MFVKLMPNYLEQSDESHSNSDKLDCSVQYYDGVDCVHVAGLHSQLISSI